MRALILLIALLFAIPAQADILPPALAQLQHNLTIAQSAQTALQGQIAAERSRQSAQLKKAFHLAVLQLQLANWPQNLLLAQSVVSQNPTQPVHLASLLQNQSTQQLNQVGTHLQTLNTLNAKAGEELTTLAALQSRFGTAQTRLTHQQKAALHAAGDTAEALARTLSAALGTTISDTTFAIPTPIATQPTPTPAPTPAPAPQPVASIPAKPGPALSLSGKPETPYHATLPGGGLSTGVTFRAPGNSAVNSLTAGTVLYAGPFRSLGGLVIVKSPKNLIIYGGLAALSVSAEETVQPHTQLGTLAPGNAARLYLEVRHGSTPVDPAPLLAATK